MAYLFNTPADTRAMLARIGVASIDDLFAQIPERLRLDGPLDLPASPSELELESHLRELAAANVGTGERVCLMGGGVYDHFIPAVVDDVASRGEFYTAYTPYQAEASQGSLQVFFEFQSLVCELTGMDVANASLYEGGTAVSEAVFMSMRATRRPGRVVVLGSLHPEYQQVLETYLNHLECELKIVETPEGTADPAAVASALNEQTSCLVIQHPNFFGCLEEVTALCDAAHNAGALAIVSFDPLSLGLLKSPADCGADIAVAEGQSLGIPAQFGGPFLGILACRRDLVRQVPGRLIGRTLDKDGRTCFVLNLQAREQHIRREKATSNICTNQGLLALRATVYLALLGRTGLAEVSELCCRKARYAADQLSAVPEIELMFDRPIFKEFVIRCPAGSDRLTRQAAQAGFDIGPALSRFSRLRGSLGEAVEETLLIAVTEQRTREDIDRLVAVFTHADATHSLT